MSNTGEFLASDRAQLATFDQNFVKSCRDFHQKLKRKVAGFQNKSYAQGKPPLVDREFNSKPRAEPASEQWI